ncbi:MAG: 4-(cytidine 5'-diphospho)-2-C-methyl-D-erythritol kinase [Ahrensia sp.]|nr:4-(cytidine 5'-diphospho)-2-C-methyl-D-erythritol kinase [Ahrensia sp.]
MRTAQAPAKINLALHVTGQRQDGYHLLDSLVVFADTVLAGDTLIVSAAPIDGFDISGAHGAGLSVGENNLVIRARDLVRASALVQGVPTPPVHISLEKRLPIASGIGGGSADAAAAVKLLRDHWGVPYHEEHDDAQFISKALGADVPMCLICKPLRAMGIGEHISRLPNVPILHMVLVNCGAQISTPQVFSGLTKKDNPPISELPERDFIGWLKSSTRNDLLEPAQKLCADISGSIEALVAEGAIYAQMSGSGATCFGLFSSARDAEIAARAIENAEPNWWVVATQTGASEGVEQNEPH